MSVTDRYTQSQARLHKSVTTELNTATAQWRRMRNAANAHLAAILLAIVEEAEFLLFQAEALAMLSHVLAKDSQYQIVT